MKSSLRRLSSPLVVCALVSSAGLASAQPTAEVPPAEPRRETTPAAAAIDAKLHAELGQSGGLTADAVGRRAAATSLEARAKELELDAAEADVDKAVVAYFPRLTLTARYTRLSSVPPLALGSSQARTVVTTAPAGLFDPTTNPMIAVQGVSFPAILDQYYLSAGLVIPLSDYLLKLSQSYTAASRSRDAARQQALASRLAAATDAKVAYYVWARARLQVVVARQAVEQAKQHLSDVEKSLAADRASKADLLRAEAQHANADLLLERAQNLVVVSEERLRTLMHDDAEATYAVGEDLLAPVPPMQRASFPALYAEAVRQRPEIRALDHSAYSLRQQRHAVAAAALPRLDAFGDAVYANPNSRIFPAQAEWKATWDVGVQLTWTPNDFGTASATARGLDAKAAEVDAQKAALTDALQQEVLGAYQAAREADVSMETTRRGLVAAEEAYRVRRELFQNDRATATEVTDAETDLLRARLELVNAHVDARVARVRLDHALGRDAKRAK